MLTRKKDAAVMRLADRDGDLTPQTFNFTFKGTKGRKGKEVGYFGVSTEAVEGKRAGLWIGEAEANVLQNNHPTTHILVNSDNAIAEDGQSCTINESILYGIEDGEIIAVAKAADTPA